MAEKDYDLFERMVDGRFKWVGMARGLTAANQRLDQLSRASGTDCVAYDLQAGRVVGTRGSAAESFPDWIHSVRSESRRLHASIQSTLAGTDSEEAPGSKAVAEHDTLDEAGASRTG